MLTQFQDYQTSQKKAAKKSKCSDNDENSDNDSSYLQSNFKHNILGKKIQ
jgi:hypothetical protein